MKYYPKSRIVTGFKTDGNEFSANGEPYSGPYYKTFDNKAFTGYNPVQGSNILLTPVFSRGGVDTGYDTLPFSNITSFDQSIEYNRVKNIKPVEIGEFLQPVSYYPNPTPQNYKSGYFMRYFSKPRNVYGEIVEVNKETYLSLQSTESEYDYVTNMSISLYWQLTGPLKDTIQPNGVRVAGIEDTNKRLVVSKSVKFRGLEEYIGGEYTKYTRPTK
jgi:hypothetical protein